MLQIQIHRGSRDELQPLFEEADDSEREIAGYRGLGEVLVAILDDEIVGELQIIESGSPSVFEIKSLAVHEDHRSRGIGAALVQTARSYCLERDGRLLLVATAAASIPALQFYQRQGFRIREVIRDFYSPDRGYRPLELNGIPLRDEVILDLDL
jgi:ribosomal protein S18 acetylase RimI-like enzyme